MEHLKQLRAESEARMAKQNDDIAVAVEFFKEHPRYPDVLLRQIEGKERIEESIGSKLPKPEVASPERLEYALALMDNIASTFMELVEADKASREAFEVVLKGNESYGLVTYRGVTQLHGGFVLPNVSATPEEIPQRTVFWRKQYLKRLIRLRSSEDAPGDPHGARDVSPHPTPPRKARSTLNPNMDLLKNPDALLSREQAAEALGMSLRHFDRQKKTKIVFGLGIIGRKRFKAKDLLKLLNERARS